LGRSIVEQFKNNGDYVVSIDLSPNQAADANVIITELGDWNAQHKQVADGMAQILNSDKVDGIYCVAGGWAGGNAASKEYLKSADMMWKQSVWSSTIAGSLAVTHLKENGVLTLTGAAPAVSGTSFMIGYGLAKAAVHQLCKSLAQSDSGLPAGSSVLCILPVTLDTPMNRKFMSGADFSTWTPLEFVAEMFRKWTQAEGRPVSGSLLKLETVKGETSVTNI